MPPKRIHDPIARETYETTLPTKGPSWLLEKTRHADEIVRYDGGTISIPHYESGRLQPYFRETLRDEDFRARHAMASRLATAAAHYAVGEDAFANALTDLCVVGRDSLAQLGARRLEDAGSIDWARELALSSQAPLLPETVARRAEEGRPRLARPSSEHLAKTEARARAVLTHLSSGPRERRALGLGWIAVSGEDDLPHRPVNVGVTSFPQRTLSLAVWDMNVVVRYAIAGELTSTSKNVLLLHGHSSRLEEVEHLATQLASRGYTVIALDLPGCGYSSPMSHAHVLFGEHPVRGDGLLPFASEPQSLSKHSSLYVLRFLLSSIRVFVERLFAEHDLAPRIELLGGGSLGGNLALLLSELAPHGRPERHGWVDPRLSFLGKIASWSPASLWTVPGIAHGTPHGRSQEPEIPDRRRDQFSRWMNIDHLPFVTIRQAEQWFHSRWPGKARGIAESWVSRHETYSSRFRTWHWILAHEQVKFSHQHEVLRPDGQGSGKRYYELAGGELLLLAGAGDNFKNTNIYDRVAELGPKIPAAGETVLVRDTGHAMHDERPVELGKLLLGFLSGRA